MKINILIGTKGQLIKIAPVLILLKKNKIDFNFINAAQHGKIFGDIIEAFRLPEPTINLMERETDVLNTLDEIVWLSKTTLNSIFYKKNIFTDSILFVHGDASPAFLGLIIKKLTKSHLAHVEAGCRSFDFFDPFPEEIIRYLVSKNSEYLYAPSNSSISNLRKMRVKGKIIDTQENTVLDSVRYSIKDYSFNVPKDIKNSVIFTIHRFESLKSKRKLLIILDILKKVSSLHKVTFVMHNTTYYYLKKHNLLNKISEDVNTIPLQVYPRFIKMVYESKFIVTDGGGLQEETSFLGKPCLILRNLTERPHGLSQNVLISKFDMNLINDFIDNYKIYERKSIINSSLSPSKKIVESLKELKEIDYEIH